MQRRHPLWSALAFVGAGLALAGCFPVHGPANRPPVAVADGASITEDAAPNTASGNLLANDTDPDGDPLVVTSFGNYTLAHGTLVVAANGGYTYTLDNSDPAVQALVPGGSLSDPSSHDVSDGRGGLATATLTVTIQGAAEGPAPTVTSVTPAVGPTSGGTIVSIVGTNLDGATSVRFGTQDAPFTITSPSTITATTPSASAGNVAVTVTGPGGTATWAGSYTYVGAPQIVGPDPSSGLTTGGQSVTITGVNLAGASVTFDGSDLPVTSNTPTAVTVTTPPHPPGAVSVFVTTAGGSSNSATYTYVSGP